MYGTEIERKEESRWDAEREREGEVRRRVTRKGFRVVMLIVNWCEGGKCPSLLVSSPCFVPLGTQSKIRRRRDTRIWRGKRERERKKKAMKGRETRSVDRKWLSPLHSIVSFSRFVFFFFLPSAAATPLQIVAPDREGERRYTHYWLNFHPKLEKLSNFCNQLLFPVTSSGISGHSPFPIPIFLFRKRRDEIQDAQLLFPKWKQRMEIGERHTSVFESIN